MIKNINSKEYWNNRFSTGDWKKNSGEKQSEFFYKVALQLIPDWLKYEILNNKYNICDLGCAEGDGTNLIYREFFNSDIFATDFSEEAIDLAKNKYKDIEFFVSDISKFEYRYDILFSSNTLEHFRNPFDIISNLIIKAKYYTILLLPLNEIDRIEEHQSEFKYSSIPIKINNSSLVYYDCIDCKEIESTHWNGEQVLLIYANEDNKKISEYTIEKLINNTYNKNLNEKTTITYIENEKLKIRNKELKIGNEELKTKNEELKGIIEEKESELLNFNNELYIKIEENELLNKSLSNIYSSTFWKVALKYYNIRDNTAIGYPFRLIKRVKNKLQRDNQVKNNEIAYSGYNEDMCYGQSENKLQLYGKNKKVYIFAGVAYYDIGGGQRSAQLAKTFYKLGYDVHYIYAYDSSENTKLKINMQLKSHIYIDDLNESFIKSNIDVNTFFIFEIPHIKFNRYLELANLMEIKTVYEHIDNWETSLGGDWFDLDIYYNFLNKSKILVATSGLLQQKLQETVSLYCDNKFKKVEYLPNAVDSEMFESLIDRNKPKDLNIGEKTLIYYGSLWGEWFDWSLIFGIAEKFPNYQINLIGEYIGIAEKFPEIPSNIHFLGLKKQEDLPSYLSYSDIAILPFENCEIGRFVSPLKIFEYISMGKSVISTRLPDINQYPNVYYGDTPEEWINILQKNEFEINNNYIEFINDNNWYKRCCDIENLINDNYKKYNEKISVIVLNRNNKKTIFRCLDSLIYNNDYNYEIIVVDNESTDGSYEMIKEMYKNKVNLLKNNKNGCSSGRNLGVKNALGDILIFLDSDQWVLAKNWIDNAMNILNEKCNIGAVGWATGWFYSGSVGGPICDYLPNRGINKNDLYRTDIAYLGTGGLVVKKSIFNMIDGFDENFDPTCYEDTDFTLKIKNLGFDLAYCPFLPIFHLPHQTTNSGDKSHTELMNKNGKYFREKWMKQNPSLLNIYLD